MSLPDLLGNITSRLVIFCYLPLLGLQSDLNVLCFRYQEILTDPSYAGQFVLMTNPQIGNTGVNIGE